MGGSERQRLRERLNKSQCYFGGDPTTEILTQNRVRMTRPYWFIALNQSFLSTDDTDWTDLLRLGANAFDRLDRWRLVLRG